MKDVYWIGMDLHKEKTMLAVYLNHDTKPVGQHTVKSEPSEIRRVLERYRPKGEVRCCYEASSCGYSIARYLRGHQFTCTVVAPHSLARSPETRVKKNDRLDAIQLAKQYRSGGLREVTLPTEQQEQVRRYVRLMDETKAECRRHKTRVSLLCLQLGLKYVGSKWTIRHRAWLEEIPQSALDREILDRRLKNVERSELEVNDLTKRCEELVVSAGGQSTVNRLMALKGIQFASAAILWSELWVGERFGSARQLMSFVGLDCKEHSSGNSEYRGSITKQGNSRCRRTLVDAAGSYRCRIKSKFSCWQKRITNQTEEVLAYSQRAEERLTKRYWHLSQTTGSNLKAKVGVARELAGFVWGMLQETSEARVSV